MTSTTIVKAPAIPTGSDINVVAPSTTPIPAGYYNGTENVIATGGNYGFGGLGNYIGSYSANSGNALFSIRNTRTIQLGGFIYFFAYCGINPAGASTRKAAIICGKLDISTLELTYIGQVEGTLSSGGSTPNIISSYIDGTNIYVNAQGGGSGYFKLDTLTDILTLTTGSIYTTGTLDNSRYIVIGNISYDAISIISQGISGGGTAGGSMVGIAEIHGIDFQPNTNIYAASGDIGSLWFKEDGMSFYVGGSTYFQFNLSTAWDLTTATAVGSYFDGTGPRAAFIGNSGSRLFRSTLTSTITRQNISTPYLISSANATGIQTYTPAETTGIYDIHFKSDGTKMYLLDYPTNKIYQYTLGTAWQISSGVTYDTVSFSSGINNNSVKIIHFSMTLDGTKMIIQLENGKSYQYSLGTPYNIGTATLINGYYTNMDLYENYSAVNSIKYTTGDRLFIDCNSKTMGTTFI